MTTVRSIQQLNAPQTVHVKTDSAGMPAQVRISQLALSDSSRQSGRPSRRRNLRQNHLKAIRSDGQWMTVISIEDFWKINDEWWRGEEQEIERVYFDLVLESSQRLTVFHDLVRDEWFRQAD